LRKERLTMDGTSSGTAGSGGVAGEDERLVLEPVAVGTPLFT